MKIVHVITRLIVGGAQENTLLSCDGQHDAGHDAQAQFTLHYEPTASVVAGCSPPNRRSRVA